MSRTQSQQLSLSPSLLSVSSKTQATNPLGHHCQGISLSNPTRNGRAIGTAHGFLGKGIKSWLQRFTHNKHRNKLLVTSLPFWQACPELRADKPSQVQGTRAPSLAWQPSLCLSCVYLQWEGYESEPRDLQGLVDMLGSREIQAPAWGKDTSLYRKQTWKG